MTRLEAPLIGRRIAATGDIVLRAEMDLLLRDQDDTLRPVTFRVDTATDMSTMPAWLARQSLCQARSRKEGRGKESSQRAGSPRGDTARGPGAVSLGGGLELGVGLDGQVEVAGDLLA